MRIDLDTLDVEESPCSLAYVILVMLAGRYGIGLTAIDNWGQGAIVVTGHNDEELFTVNTPGVWAELLVAILKNIASDIENIAVQPKVRDPWASQLT